MRKILIAVLSAIALCSCFSTLLACNVGGNSGKMVNYISQGHVIYTQTAINGQVQEYSPQARDGYVFDGWYLDGSLSIPFTNTTLESITQSQINVFAKWQAIYSVKNGEIIGLTEYAKKNVKSLVIPFSIDEQEIIGLQDFCFINATNLESVTISKNVSSIGKGIFSGCEKLVSVVVEDFNPKFHSYENCIIDNSLTLVAGCKTSVIMNPIERIGDMAFYNCKGLTEIEIPWSVVEIKESAFEKCENLEKVSFPDGLGLNDAVMQSTLNKVGVKAFKDCTKLTKIEFPNTLTAINGSAFNNCVSIKNIVIPKNVLTLGAGAFDGCYLLENVEFAKDSILENIQTRAFANCSALTSVKLPATLKNIGNEGFMGCSALKIIEFGGDLLSWQSVTRGNLWLEGTLVSEIICADGVA